MNTNKYAIFLDIDNTLMVNGEIPQGNIDAIKKAQKDGHLVFINTGRSFSYIPKKLTEAIDFDGFVAGIGSDIRVHNKQIFSHSIPMDELLKIAKYFENDSREIGFEGEEKTIWINPKDFREDPYILTSPEDFNSIYANEKISMIYIGDKLTSDEVIMFSKKNSVFVHENYSEFVPTGFNKGDCMIMAAEHVGIPITNCIAMGDSTNDTDMLKMAGISVAMGDAVDEIKSICSFISCDAKDCGVAFAINHFLFNS